MIINSNRLLQGVACATLLVATAACSELSMPSPEMASAHVPVVTQTMLVHELSSGGGALSQAEIQSLNEWLDAIGVNYGDRISISDPYPGSQVRRAAVADALSRYGLLLSDTAPVVGDSASPRVIVMRAKAEVPGCPDWSRPSNLEFDGSKMSNYGCANGSNIAAMVVDANDLVSGKPHAGTDAETTVKAIQTYRAKAGNATQTVESTVGQVSSKSGN